MASVSIITTKRGTLIRKMTFPPGTSIGEVDRIAQVFDSLIAPDASILRVEVDYTECDDE